MASLKGQIWRLRGDSTRVSGSLLDRLLQRRGVKPSEVPLFLAPRLADLPSPFSFSQMEKAVAIVKRLARQKGRVVIYGDYDVDGVASSAIISETLSSLNLAPRVYIPERLREGYGMKLASLREIVKEKPDCLIAVDTGITASEEISFLKTKKIETIVIDHHEPKEKLPLADAILNPKAEESGYPFKELSSSGISFQLARALDREIKGGDRETWRFLDLAALGTIADVVPLLSDNRIIAKFGLERMSASRRPGLLALRKLLSLDGVLDTHHVSFMIGPRLNAAGRIEHASLAYNLLTSGDVLEAYELAQYLHELNLIRQNLTDKIFLEAKEQARSQLKRNILLVAGKGWSIGVAGIVANRLVEEFRKPAVVFEEVDGYLKGSARSIEGVDLYSLLEKASDLLESFGGHKGAAGLMLKKEDFPRFQKKLWQSAKAIPPKLMKPTLYLDEMVEAKEIGGRLHEELTRLKPYGLGNEEPLLWLREARIREVRKSKGSRGPHLKVLFEGLNMPAYWFGEGERASRLSPGQRVEAALSLGTMNYLGHPILRLRLHDIGLLKLID